MNFKKWRPLYPGLSELNILLLNACDICVYVDYYEQPKMNYINCKSKIIVTPVISKCFKNKLNQTTLNIY